MVKKRKINVNPLHLLMVITVLLAIRVSGQQQVQDSINLRQLNDIKMMLEKGKPAANLWWQGWLWGYSAATIVQTTIGITASHLKTRQDMFLGAGTTLLGAAGQFVMPMTPSKAPDLLSKLPEITPPQIEYKLLLAQEYLRLSAEREREGRSWKTHAICGVVNLGSGMITWIGFKRSIWAGLGNFALNTAISEAQIWTMPTKALKDYRNFINNNPEIKPLSRHYQWKWSVTAFPGGASLHLVF